LQEEALVVRRPVELAERLVAELAIEAGRLEAVGVDPGAPAAALDRPGLGGRHELASDPLAPQRLADPKILDEEPAGVGLSREARDDALPIAREDGERAPLLVAGPSAFVEVLEPVGQNFNVLFDRLVLDVEAKARG
jgi:hypothetical protein